MPRIIWTSFRINSGYVGKYNQMKEAVKQFLRVEQEVFMSLTHRSGETQADFDYALAKVSGRRDREAKTGPTSFPSK